MLPRYQRINRKRRRSEKNKQYHGKKTNNDLQNTTQETTDYAARTLLTTGVNSGTQEGLAVPPLLVPRYRNRTEEIILTKTLL